MTPALKTLAIIDHTNLPFHCSLSTATTSETTTVRGEIKFAIVSLSKQIPYIDIWVDCLIPSCVLLCFQRERAKVSLLL